MKHNFLLLLLLLSAGSYAQQLTVAQTDSGTWVYESGMPVLFFQVATKSLAGAYPRANYVHPLFGLDGAVLTEDFPEDHLHQRGIFWAWHQVLIGDKAMGDAWECRDFVWEVARPAPEWEAAGQLSLQIKTRWKSHHWVDATGEQQPFVEEHTKITVYPTTSNYRIIDFEISLLALVPKVKIGGSDDLKGYGGFSLRLKTPDDLGFRSPAGILIPALGPVQAGAWVDINGSLQADGGRAGVKIIPHPQNPAFPGAWILRKKESMQNAVYPGRTPVAISETVPTLLKYRLIVYKGKRAAYAPSRN